MADPKGDTLLVNISAAAARRRLKGFGHGVRKVHSAGRNQALIIHTATGRHLAELEAKFSDVGYTSTDDSLSEPIDNLRNLGSESAGWLRDVGVRTITDLEALGPVEAYHLVKQRQPDTSLNLLWALAAGLAGRDWQTLSDEEKKRLLAEFDAR